MAKPLCVVVGVGPKNGASLARRFAQEGYQLALVSRQTSLSLQLAAELADTSTSRPKFVPGSPHPAAL
jgi:short-subunit dehydrogenase